MCLGPNGSVTAFMSVNRISPNSCHEPLSSWPAEVQNMFEKSLSCQGLPSALMSARHAACAALEKLRLQGVGLAAGKAGFGQSAVVFWNWLMWYWYDCPGSRYGPNGTSSTPYWPKESSIQ